jgi:hypothetical protein
MKRLVLVLGLVVSTLSFGQVDVIKTDSDGRILYMGVLQNSPFKTVSLNRVGENGVRLSFKFKSDNSTQSALYTVKEAYTTTYEDKKCTRMNIKNDIGVKLSIIVSYDGNNIYIIEDDITYRYSGTGVKYE